MCTTHAHVSLGQVPPATPHLPFHHLPEHRNYTSQPPLQRGVAKGSLARVVEGSTPLQTWPQSPTNPSPKGTTEAQEGRGPGPQIQETARQPEEGPAALACVLIWSTSTYQDVSHDITRVKKPWL